MPYICGGVVADPIPACQALFVLAVLFIGRSSSIISAGSDLSNVDGIV
jgi:hypothetical protein